MIGAILRAQILSMRLRKGTGRTSAAFSVFTGAIFYGVFTLISLAMMFLFSSQEEAPQFPALLSSILLVIMLYWQLGPVLSASFGASIDLRKLTGYPIPRHKLFTVEVILRAVTCFDTLLVLTGICAGLLRNPLYGSGAALLVIPAALAFAAMNVLLSAGTRNWMERFFATSRFKEVFFLFFASLWFIPRLLTVNNVHAASLLRFVPSFTALPWTAAAQLMLHRSAGVSALALAAWTGVTLLFGRRQFARMLNFDATSAKKKVRDGAPGGLAETFFRIPSRFLSDPLAAMIEKELRGLFRIPRFRMVFGMSCLFGVLMFAPLMHGKHPMTGFVQYALPGMGVYGLLMLGQITYWNAFGFDRSAAQGYFSWPVRLRDALIAKNLTVLVLITPQILLVSLVARLFHIPASPAKIVETFAVVIVASLFWLALGNIASVRTPRAMNPDKLNQMSNKTQSLTLLIAPVVLLPIVLAYWARSVFASDIVFAAIMAVAAIIGVIFYGVALDSAVASAMANRESMLMELSRADGPISLN